MTRPDRGAIAEAARTSDELRDLALPNQRLAVNGVFQRSGRSDEIACAIEDPPPRLPARSVMHAQVRDALA
jgi:arsenite-transporting ATPase